MRWFIGVAIVATMFCAGGAASADGRFFLVVANEIPTDAFVSAAYSEARALASPVKADEAHQRLGDAFPGLYFRTRSSDRQTLEAELKNGRVAHYNSQFDQAEVHLKTAFNLISAHPELLDGDQALSQRLIDGALLRYANSEALSPGAPKALATLKDFVRRYQQLSPTSTDFPPQTIQAWKGAHESVVAATGRLMVHAQPLAFERSGECRLLLNGADGGQMPLGGSVRLPIGDHRVQVRCGMRRSWSQRVMIQSQNSTTLRVPVRAMMAARVDQETGAVVLVDPAEGDAASLVAAISQGASFKGAVVARTAIGRANLGRWDAGSDGPSHERTGTIVGDRIVDVRAAAADRGGVRPLRVAGWTSVAVGAGLVVGGVVVNGTYNDALEGGRSLEDIDHIKTASLALYVTGGVVAATGIALLIVDAIAGGDAEQIARVQATSGGLAFRF